jgi:DNA helicase TIP49 (TBP-interacting protein)
VGQAEEGGAGEDDEWLVAETPEVSFDDIAGMAEAKEAIFDMIVHPMREPEKARLLKLKPGGGVLLYGPPGTGKTMFGKAIAHEIDAPFFYASGARSARSGTVRCEQRLSRLIRPRGRVRSRYCSLMRWTAFCRAAPAARRWWTTGS